MPESELVPVLSEADIQKRVTELARRISSDYRDAPLVLIGVLKGAFIFMADLVRRLEIPVEIEFVRASSYGHCDTSSGEVRLRHELGTDIADKHALIVEDILDTGRTIETLISCIAAYRPRSIRVCACIDKTERRIGERRPDYSCYAVEQGFLVGYGLDYAEQYRHLPGIYALKNLTNEE